jgi:hypothetical protein
MDISPGSAPVSGATAGHPALTPPFDAVQTCVRTSTSRRGDAAPTCRRCGGQGRRPVGTRGGRGQVAATRSRADLPGSWFKGRRGDGETTETSHEGSVSVIPHTRGDAVSSPLPLTTRLLEYRHAQVCGFTSGRTIPILPLRTRVGTHIPPRLPQTAIQATMVRVNASAEQSRPAWERQEGAVCPFRDRGSWSTSVR